MVSTPCVGVGEGEELGVGVEDGEGEALGVGFDVGFDVGPDVGEAVPVGEGVLLAEEVGDGEDEAVGVGVGVGPFVDEEELDRAYATINTNKQAHTNKTINIFLFMFHLN